MSNTPADRPQVPLSGTGAVEPSSVTPDTVVPSGAELDHQDQPAPKPSYSCLVTGIEWERVTVSLHLRVNPAAPDAAPAVDPSELHFELVDGARVYPVNAIVIREGEFRIDINVTRFNGRRQIPNGTWRVRAQFDGAPRVVASYDGRELKALDEASRVFLYNKNLSVFVTGFGIAEDVDSLHFLMRTYQLNRSAPKKKKKRVGPIKAFKRRYLNEAHLIRYAGWIYRQINQRVGVKKGRILFASDQRLTIAGNLQRVQERLIERGLDSRLDMKYSFRMPRTTGWGTTLRILWLMATSEVILLDDYFGILKSIELDKKRTRVIQLWHAGSGFKSVGYSRFGNIGSPKFWHPHRQYTYAITGSTHLVPVYAEAFGIEESAVIPTGLPRVDWFLDDARTQSFTERFTREYPELDGKRVILFAPTFRGRSIYTAFYDYDWIDFDRLYEACGPDTVVLFRMHHFIKTPVPIPEQYRDRFFDFSHYSDGLDLLHKVDLLITDYSSIIYEFSLLDRPMIFYAPDKVNYEATRGFHRPYDDTAPGRVCITFDQVIDSITTGDFEQEKVAKFRAKNFDRIDTGAADRVIDWLILNNAPPVEAKVEEIVSTEFADGDPRPVTASVEIDGPGENSEAEEAAL